MELKETFAFFQDRGKLGDLTSRCRDCQKKYYEDNRERRLDYDRKYYEDNRERLVNQSRSYYEENREKLLKQKRKYYKKNHERQLEKRRRHYKENRERLLEYSRKYYEENKEIRRRYHKENPDKVRLHYNRRRARKNALPDDFNHEQQNEVLATFNNACALTGESTSRSWDHAIPLATGHGGTTYGNMYPLRLGLNISKHDRNIFEWFEANRQRFELSQDRFDSLIAWLASANAMSVEEYRDYVYQCHENPRTIDELKEEA
ncbi:hypothetical protein [Rossellomorea sp. FS2]|uniref:hypothetical protein n=1 Tax=Rossellomorea sp. FS2 TaxID=3391447 RepID=UPI003A4D1DD3